ncbi:MAG: hypothetical protein ACXWDI_01425 [Nocardioides sp.]
MSTIPSPQTPEVPVADLAFLTLAVLFFAVTALVVKAVERL